MPKYVDKKLAQQIVSSVKDICEKDINFINENGFIFASTNEARIGTYHEIGHQAAVQKHSIEVSSASNFEGTQNGVNIPITHNGDFVAVIGITGNPDEVRKYARLAEQITRLFLREQDINTSLRSQAEKRTYIARSLLQGEIHNHEYMIHELEDLKVDIRLPKRVLCIKINSRYHTLNISMLETKIYQLFTAIGTALYTYEYPNVFFAILDDNKLEPNRVILQHFAQSYHDILNVAVGSKVSIYHLKESCDTSVSALRTHSSRQEGVIFYDTLTLELILGSVKEEISQSYIDKTLSSLTDSEKELLQAYFDEGKSLGSTSQRLHLHKNTLQYK